jgi:hypothetical protein
VFLGPRTSCLQPHQHDHSRDLYHWVAYVVTCGLRLFLSLYLAGFFGKGGGRKGKPVSSGGFFLFFFPSGPSSGRGTPFALFYKISAPLYFPSLGSGGEVVTYCVGERLEVASEG